MINVDLDNYRKKSISQFEFSVDIGYIESLSQKDDSYPTRLSFIFHMLDNVYGSNPMVN